MVKSFVLISIVIICFCVSCQNKIEKPVLNKKNVINWEITDQVLLHAILDYVQIIDSTKNSNNVLKVFYEKRCDGSHIYHICSYLSFYSFYNSNIDMLVEFDGILIALEVEGENVFELDSISRINLMEQWFPLDYESFKSSVLLAEEFPDIDLIPPPATGVSPVLTIRIKDNVIIERRIE